MILSPVQFAKHVGSVVAAKYDKTLHNLAHATRPDGGCEPHCYCQIAQRMANL